MANDEQNTASGRAGAPPPGSRATAGPPATGGKGYSRRSKRPRVKAPNGSAAARQLLTEAQVTEGLRLDSEDLRVLRACCSMRPPRNAAAIVAAIKARLEYSQRKPKTEVEHSGGLNLTFISAYAGDPPKGPTGG